MARVSVTPKPGTVIDGYPCQGCHAYTDHDVRGPGLRSGTTTLRCRQCRHVVDAPTAPLAKHLRNRGHERGRARPRDLQPAVASFTASPVHFEAAQAWSTRRAYWDGRNYRVRSPGRSSGPVAPWNRAIKHDVGGPDHLHALAAHLGGRGRGRTMRAARRRWRR